MDLDAIRSKVKEYIGDSGYDDDDMDEIINRHYRDNLPLEFDLDSLHTTYSQTLSAQDEDYDVDQDSYLWVRGPAYIDDLESDTLARISFTKDKQGFRSRYPELADSGAATDYDGLPAEVLYHKGTLYFGPIPNDGYKTYFEAYAKPTALSADDDEPVESAWGPILACDTALEILITRNDEENAQGISQARKYFASLIESKEIVNMVDVRAPGSF